MIFVCAVLLTAISLEAALESSHRQRRRERILQRTGGQVEKRSAAKGRFVFVNAQLKVAPAVISETVKVIENMTRFVFEVVARDDVDICNLDSVRQETGGAGIVAVVDKVGMPCVLVAPESRWCVINVAKLSADEPSCKTLDKRLSKELWRAVGCVAGVGYASGPCVMAPVDTLSELDNLKTGIFSPESVMRVEERFQSMGLVQFPRATYRVACQEGWAPPPTNDCQKSIWNEIHAIPQHPLTIEYDPKRGL